jgi:probable HAF family extracellular repeat protein
LQEAKGKKEKSMRSIRTIVILLLTSLNTGAISAAEIQYNVIDLGEGTAWSVNNNGQVVGDSYGYATLFDTTGNGNNIRIGTNIIGSAWAINNSGQIVGYEEVGSPSTHHAMLFDSSGNYNNNIDLNPFTSVYPSYARGINNHGQIVGESWYSAVLFDPTGNGNNIPIVGGAAHSINDNGQIVGIGSDTAFLYDTTTEQTTWLGTLGGERSYARSINNSGQIVGVAWLAGYGDQQRHATLFDPTGGGNNIDLGTLGLGNSDALCINNKGEAVGMVGVEHTGSCYATLFDTTGQGNNILLNTVIDPTCGWNLVVAKGINDNGWIVGYGINPDGAYHAFLLTPEPATLLLFGLGAVILRKRKV